MTKKFYITTPIYYVNAEPHIGNAYTTITADVIARWHRLKGEDVFFLTGTDEHGQKIQETAEKSGLKPKEFVDSIVTKFKQAFKMLNISNDNFIRTTNLEHEKEVKNILQELYDKKLIYNGFYEAYYCVGCEQYITKSDLIDGKCPLHKKEPKLQKEESYMFKLSNFQDKLLKLIEKGEYCILPEKKRNEIIYFIKRGLQDISVSRKKSKVYWGIEMPFDKNHTCYVWIDAFWNYITGLKEKKAFDKFWPANVQLMANDILRVHATIWPALLLGTGNKLPKTLYVHGYFTINGQKISKSLGNIISPIYLTEKYGVDSVRYYLCRNVPFGEDGNFSEQELKDRINNELAANLGNLVSRVLTLAEKSQGKIKFDGKAELEKHLNLKKIASHYDAFELHLAVKEIWSFIGACNKYVNDKQPWKLQGRELGNVLYNLLEALRVTAILISPVIPETAEKICRQLGCKLGNLKDCKFKKFEEKVKKGEHLFEKVK